MPEVILTKENIRKLLAAGNGDSALLYLCRAGGISEVATGFSEPRLEAAAALLRQLGLDESRNPKFQVSAEPPVYSVEDIRRQMELPRSGFRKLVGEVQRCLGKVLNVEELKILLSMVEYLGLPAEVVNILLHYCVERSRSHGAGRMPSMRIVEKEAFRWADEQIDSVEKAAAYMQSQNAKAGRMEALSKLLGISGRRLAPPEERYLQSWIEMGFETDAISLAYDKTCENTGGLTWKYMNRIIESWNAQGLHTVAQIKALDRKPGQAGRGGYQRHGETMSPMMQDAVNRMLSDGQEDG